jgi:uncharacterized protein with HEPN domain
MSSDSDFRRLNDIRHNIELARSFVSGHSYEAFCADQRTVYAVVRCLEISSEATRRLTTDLKQRHPSLPWSNIAGAGNIYRHDYERVLHEIVWQTVKDLDPLWRTVQLELERLNKP